MSLELLNDEGFRVDGRKFNELRRIRCNLGVFQQADGSAYIEQGNTKIPNHPALKAYTTENNCRKIRILAAIYGPHEPSLNLKSKTPNDSCLINCEYSQAAFSRVERKMRPRGDRGSREMSLHIKQTFEGAIHTSIYPRSQIDIYLQVLQSDGSDYAASVNVATLALIDAGIPMKDYVIACSASIAKNTSIIDVNNIEESVGTALLSAAILPKLKRIVYTDLNGKVHKDEMGSLLDAVESGCQDVFAVLDQHVRDHIKDTSENFANS